MPYPDHKEIFPPLFEVLPFSTLCRCSSCCFLIMLLCLYTPQVNRCKAGKNPNNIMNR